MRKNNKLINDLVKIASRNREQNVDVAVKRQTPIFCAAACLALKKMSPECDADILKDFLIEMQEIIDKHPHDIIKTCREETGVDIRTGGNNEKN